MYMFKYCAFALGRHCQMNAVSSSGTNNLLCGEGVKGIRVWPESSA